jgi:GntR family transcriptional regulator, sialic acid-inducible nan operon repressor
LKSFAKPSTAIRHDRLSDKIALDIEARILSGEIAVGDSLPSERDLMAHYAVGRPAVREALLWLNKKGLLAISTGDRAKVTEPNPKEILELLSGAAKMLVARPDGVRLFQNTRTFVECAIAREAAIRVTPAEIKQLEALVLENENCGSDVQAFSATDDAFHHGIAAISHNPLVDALYQSVLELLEEQRRMSLSHPEALERARGAHRAIFEAIRAKDPDRAELEMRKHLATVEETYWEIFKRNRQSDDLLPNSGSTLHRLHNPRSET